jgi:hypothetical protein
VSGQSAAEALEAAAVVVVEAFGAALGVTAPEVHPASTTAPATPDRSHHRRRRPAVPPREAAERATTRARRVELVNMASIVGERSYRVGDAGTHLSLGRGRGDGAA